jgi:hypothetical protein
MLTAWEHPDRIQPVRVLRVTLRGPVTLGHVLLLDELGSPVVQGEEFNIGHLGIAAMVCKARTASEARADLNSWWARMFLRSWAMRCGRLQFEQESIRFIGWFSEQCGGPEQKTVVKDGQAPPKGIAAPWYINKLATAVGELGLSISDAESLPVKRINQLSGALYESRGNAEFTTQDEADFFENVKLWEAEKAEKGTA